ncbi:hypothetical protein A4A49_60424, partial [Nicotiana attenuata]
VSTDVVFLETTPFFYAPPISTSQGEEDEWLVYQVTRTLTEQSDDTLRSPSSSIEHQSTIMPSVPAPARPPIHQSTIMPSVPAPARPPIVQVYSRRRETNATCPAPVPASSDSSLPDPPDNLDLPIALRKGTRTCKSTYSVANFVSYDHLSSTSRSMIASLDSISVTKTVKKALNHPGWSDAMLEEIHALEDNHT